MLQSVSLVLILAAASLCGQALPSASSVFGGSSSSTWCPPSTTATVTSLGAGCGAPEGQVGAPASPVLTASPVLLGRPVQVAVHSDFQGRIPVFLVASFSDAGSFDNPGDSSACGGGTERAPYFFDPNCNCVVFVDVCTAPAPTVGGDGLNWFVLFEGLTDANGDLFTTIRIDNPALLGRTLNIQARLCPAVLGTPGCYQGLDYLTNGLGLRIGNRSEGSEGRSPGFWKQRDRRACWPSPYTASSLFSCWFVDAFPGKTMLDVLNQGGGGLNALGRQAVAAILNAQESGIDFEISPATVIALFNAAAQGTPANIEALKNYLEGLNNLGGGTLTGCPRCW